MHHRPGAPTMISGALAAALLAGSLLSASALAAEPSVIVGPGDTLSEIALRHGTTTARLVALNHLADPNRIFAGQRLLLPGPASHPTAPASATAPALRVHVVASGEHLTGIAQRFGTTIDELVRLNALPNPNLIRTGQRLLVPGDRAVVTATKPATPPAPAPITHRVRAGENLTVIAERYRTSVAAVVALNHIANAGYIRAGDLLRIPGTRASSAAAAPSLARLPADVARRMAARTGVRDLIIAEARRAGVPVAMALAVAWQESGWQQSVVSGAGAIGVMQLLPATADWVAGSMLGTPVDLHSTRQNVRAGVTLLRHYLVRYHADQRRALAAYYQGQRSVDEHGIFPVSRPYIASILALEALLQP